MGVPQLTLIVKVFKREAGFITNLIAHDFEINIGIEVVTKACINMSPARSGLDCFALFEPGVCINTVEIVQ